MKVVGLRGAFGVVVLAAGRSSRMGLPKLLLRWGGATLLRRALEAAVQSGSSEVVVVLGEEAYKHRTEVPRGIRVAINPDFAQGQSTSLRRGVEALSESVRGAVFYPADQPYVTPDAIRRVVANHVQSGKPLVVSRAGGVSGPPVYVARQFFPDLLAVQGDQGAREVVRANPQLVSVEEFDDPDLLFDIDTPEDYAELVLCPAPPLETRSTVARTQLSKIRRATR